MNNLLAFLPGMPGVPDMPSMPTGTGFHQTMSVIGVPLALILFFTAGGVFICAADSIAPEPKLRYTRMWIVAPLILAVAVFSGISFGRGVEITRESELIKTSHYSATAISGAEITQEQISKTSSRAAYVVKLQWKNSGNIFLKTFTSGPMTDLEEGDKVCLVKKTYRAKNEWNTKPFSDWTVGECNV